MNADSGSESGWNKSNWSYWKSGGELAKVSDIAVKVPEVETYMIQELHLPIYHCWCLMLEDKFFGVDE